MQAAKASLTMILPDVIDQCVSEQGERPMAWFDRSAGGKREPEKAPEKVSPTPQLAAESMPVVVPKPAAQPVRAPVETALMGYLYKGSRVTGHLIFQGSARIDGNVEGEIRCHGTLTIGEGAEIRAKISAQSVVIRGRVEGNVAAKDKLELLAPGRLYGNISTSRLVMSEGVVFDGDCSMGVANKQSGVGASQGPKTEKTATAQAPRLKTDSE
jgi:cytoskeletal protein CcmA (bactofilin family)